MFEMLVQQYGFNEPIFLDDLKGKTLSDNALRQTMKRLVDDGKLVRFDSGIYYIPKPIGLLKQSYIDLNKIIVSKYIVRRHTIFGYYSGFTFANQIGITSQVPAQKEIVTNAEATNGRTVNIGASSVRLRKPKVEITAENVIALQLLDLINDAQRYSEISDTEMVERIQFYVKEKNITREMIAQLVPFYPDKVSKKLIESRLIYVFAS